MNHYTYLSFHLQLRTLNGIAQWDDIQEAIQAKLVELSYEYGAHTQILTQELSTELNKIKRQKRLGIGRLAEALFYNIRVKHAVVRDSYINKNLNKLVSLNKILDRWYKRRKYIHATKRKNNLRLKQEI